MLYPLETPDDQLFSGAIIEYEKITNKNKISHFSIWSTYNTIAPINREKIENN